MGNTASPARTSSKRATASRAALAASPAANNRSKHPASAHESAAQGAGRPSRTASHLRNSSRAIGLDSPPNSFPTSNASKSPLCVHKTMRVVLIPLTSVRTGPSQLWGCASLAKLLDEVAKRRWAPTTNGRWSFWHRPFLARALRSVVARSALFLSTARCTLS